MKIDPRIQLPGDASPERVKNTRGGVQHPEAPKTSGVSPAAGEDTVKLSSTHGEVQTLAANLAHVPEVRTERVNALRQQVRNASYHPDSGQVADAVIAEHSKVNVKA
jgi:flagellar biosynthesis anti-sigma factor FlgM